MTTFHTIPQGLKITSWSSWASFSPSQVVVSCFLSCIPCLSDVISVQIFWIFLELQRRECRWEAAAVFPPPTHNTHTHSSSVQMCFNHFLKTCWSHAQSVAEFISSPEKRNYCLVTGRKMKNFLTCLQNFKTSLQTALICVTLAAPN